MSAPLKIGTNLLQKNARGKWKEGKKVRNFTFDPALKNKII